MLDSLTYLGSWMRMETSSVERCLERIGVDITVDPYTRIASSVSSSKASWMEKRFSLPCRPTEKLPLLLCIVYGYELYGMEIDGSKASLLLFLSLMQKKTCKQEREIVVTRENACATTAIKQTVDWGCSNHWFWLWVGSSQRKGGEKFVVTSSWWVGAGLSWW